MATTTANGTPGTSRAVLYSAGVAGLGFICFAIAATAVGLPLWGYYTNGHANVHDRYHEEGYFGPWKVCKILLYNRERCEPGEPKFKPSPFVFYSGVMAAVSTTTLGVFCILSVVQLSMATSKDTIGCCNYIPVVICKLVLALIAALLAIVAASLFALQTDHDPKINVFVTRGESFYIQIVTIVLTFVLFVLALYDVLFARRTGGDPTRTLDPQSVITYGNPGFREGRNGIAVTAASGKPYSTGSVNSMVTATTTVSNGSTVSGSIARSPLRSSLKKPRTRTDNGAGASGIGIQNPGFSGHSPTLSRNGSVKKVRIQTHSTAV